MTVDCAPELTPLLPGGLQCRYPDTQEVNSQGKDNQKGQAGPSNKQLVGVKDGATPTGTSSGSK